MRFRLRYLHHDLELTEGQFVIGRNASCQLSLDDPLVSRRHALLSVTVDAVYIEDLQSRNGVSVNSQRIAQRVAIRPGDQIVIGAQELTLLQGRDVRRDAPSSNQIGKRTLPKVQTSSRNDVPSLVEQDAEPSMIRRAEAFSLLGAVAEKALAMGRADEAERILASALADVIEAARAGKRMSPALADQAARFSAKLATATSKGAWADYVIELYTSQGRPCPAPVVDEMYNALRRVSGVDMAKLRAYVAQLREKSPSFGPADRFLFQRIEGLERLASLR